MRNTYGNIFTLTSLAPCLVAAGVVEVSQAVAFQAAVGEALEKEPQLKTCDYEFRLPKPSYTWHTLQAISQEFTDIEFTLLIGGDNWAAFDKWYHHEDILAHYPIVVYPRQGSSVGEVPEGVTIVATPLLNISSTEIRQRIKEGKSIKGMVPESIEELVKRNYNAR